MQGYKLVAVNTIAQYVRTVINIVLSLITVRLILGTLGPSDYGIYSLIAGVTAMLAFMTNALISTTQRFMSFYQGKNDIDKMKAVFSNSVTLHVVLGAFIVIVLLSITNLLFNKVLTIPIERVDASIYLYYMVVVILLLTFWTAPYRALLVSHENIVYISIVDILDGILKLFLVFSLSLFDADKLVVYGIMLLIIQIINTILLFLYPHKHYEECIFPQVRLLEKSYFLELFKYAGWVIYGTGCAIGRTQGIAIVVNKFFGTVANAAYGLGLQVSSAIGNISSALLNAMRPQIIKAEGAGDHQRSIYYTCLLCKASFFLMAAICIPCCFELESILKLWLGEIPAYTILFTEMSIIAALVDTLTLGLSVSNEAIGNIKEYNITIGTLKFCAMPLAFMFIALGYDAIFILYCYVGMELFTAFIRLPFLKKTGGLDVKQFLSEVLGREIVPTLIIIISSFIISKLKFGILGIILNYFVSVSVFSLTIYLIGLTVEEKTILKKIIRR